jgi:D-alanine-D-alanine ligase
LINGKITPQIETNKKMTNKKNIAVVAGGYSSEYEVSINSAQNIYSAIDSSKYNKYLVVISNDEWNVHYNNELYLVDKNDFSFQPAQEKIKFDFAYITIHGTPGENGLLQGYLEMLDIPHSTCNTLAASLTFDKYTCNHYLKQFGITVSDSVLLTNKEYSLENIIEATGIPCFVKPNADGSSFGISKVKKESELKEAIENAFTYCSQVIVESYIDGLEFTCGVIKTDDKEIILPVTEVLPKNEFFDFEAKYDPTMAEEITPARISQELTQRIQNLSSKIYDILRCKGIIRVDFIIKNDIIYVLEVNTTPGMTSNSFIPKQIEAAGLNLSDILSLIIEQ